MDRTIGAGNAQADLALGGRFPAHSINIVMGPPGSGKTVCSKRLASVGMDDDRVRSFEATLDESVRAKICGLLACDPDRFLAAPVIQRGTIRGLLAVHRRSATCSEPEAAMLSALADQAAIALAQVT